MSVTDRLIYVLVTGFGTGLAPVASGTFGTLPGIAIAVGLQLSLAGNDLLMALWITSAVLLAIGMTLTGFTARVFKRGDPGPFVLDEIVGYLVATAMWVTVFGAPSWVAHSALFFFFRLFDVLKPYPANRFERIPGAIGIMLDDVMAGIYAGAVVLAIGAVVTL